MLSVFPSDPPSLKLEKLMALACEKAPAGAK
jgi:hypothetical protein